MLLKDFPKLFSQLHSTKNGNIDTNNVSYKSGLKVWWVCDKGHEWQAKIFSRMDGNNCPYCSGKFFSEKNSFVYNYPELIKEWDYNKNINVDIHKIKYSSKLKVWWKCKYGHEWEAKILNRTINKSGCPYCSGSLLTEKNSLVYNYPELIKEWIFNKNTKFDINKITYGNKTKVWWKCKNGHEWEASILNRTTKNSQCPNCNFNNTSQIEIRLYCELKCIFSDIYNRKKINNIEVDIFIPLINLLIEYDGSYWHKNKEDVDLKKNEILKENNYNIIRIREYPLCVLNNNDIIYIPKNKFLNTIKELLILINSKYVIPDLYKKRIYEYLKTDSYLNPVEYNDIINNLIMPIKTNLSIVYPNINKDWNEYKNGLLKLDMFSKGSHRKVWWKCENGHEYERTIKNKFKYNNCPICKR